LINFNKNKASIASSIKNYERKRAVISFYSKGTNACSCCGEKHLDFLTIDHTNHDGKAHRKKVGVGGLYTWLIKNNFPTNLNLRVLCMNCNFATRYGVRCPHETERLPPILQGIDTRC
jgi:hypothetical protein